MKKKLIGILFVFLAACIWAQDGTRNFDHCTISVSFYNRQVYYPGDDESEPIFVRFTINNSGAETLYFKLADDHAFSVDFTVLDTRSRSLPHTDYWMRKRTGNRHVYFREISLEPGESYSFIENIKEYIDFKNPGMFLVKAAFYPELKRLSDNSEISIVSNNLTVDIKPSTGVIAVDAIPVSPTTHDLLSPQPLPPDQVLMYTLTARQKSRWQEFFLYFDFNRLIARDPSRNARFKAESEVGRLSMIDTYKHELAQEKADKDISMIPVDFEIEKTTYTATQAEVQVIEWFAYRNFKEKKRFTYYLASRNGIWYIYDYMVENLGTE